MQYTINQRVILAYILGMATISVLNTYTNPEKISDYYSREEVVHLMQETGYKEYNKGYKEGMLYAYDNVVVCGASPEAEGIGKTCIGFYRSNY